MDKERLKQLNKMQEHLNELEYFLWRINCKRLLGIALDKGKRTLLKCLGYGALDEYILKCDKVLTDRIIDTVEKYKEELQREFEEK